MNGLPAATAEAAAGDWVFRIGAVQIGASMYRLIFADRTNGAAIDAALAATLRLVPPHDGDRDRAAAPAHDRRRRGAQPAKASQASQRACRGPSEASNCSGS